jgi:hypothetical protein
MMIVSMFTSRIAFGLAYAWVPTCWFSCGR